MRAGVNFSDYHAERWVENGTKILGELLGHHGSTQQAPARWVQRPLQRDHVVGEETQMLLSSPPVRVPSDPGETRLSECIEFPTERETLLIQPLPFGGEVGQFLLRCHEGVALLS